MKRIVTIILILILAAQEGFCWIFPEHRDIMVLAIQKLDPARRASFERLWLQARTGRESRLSALPADTGISKGTKFLDYATFPAIGGDHSTSASDMVHSVLTTDWIFKVSDVAFELRTGLANAKNRTDRLNKLRDSDLRLLKADPEYVTRAGANNVHFMLARKEVNTDMVQFLSACAKAGCELNAPGTYTYYHLSALRKAKAYAENPSAEKSADLLFSAFADEGFGLHFLEDMFASGHVAGTRGNAAQRKGTHDHYDETGIEAYSWEGEGMVLMGDAFMRPEDADLAAMTVVRSLEQIVDAASGKYSSLITSASKPASVPDTFNVCKALVMPAIERDTLAISLFKDIFRSTARPGLAQGAGELPRFRAELGPFIGLSAALRGNAVFNGFCESQNTAGEITGLEVNFRVGLGLEGILNEASDGAVFLEAGYRLDGSSTIKLAADPDLEKYGNISSAIPYRNGIHLRLRMPFYIVPGDLLVVAPILYIFAPKAASTMIATAGNGGLIPWQAGMLSSIGRFQFVLGREVGVCFFGYGKNPDTFIVPVTINGVADQAVISFHSTQIEFPVLEYRPFHMFSSDQTAGLMIQIFGGVDIPGKETLVTSENIPVPEVRSIWYCGLRFIFDWRYYFSGKKS
ncbi:MAG: hypothetical protein NTU98_08875 [Bacteroidetes bacterium]|nr:hypothetical protein [Bacteroidota bacterium]